MAPTSLDGPGQKFWRAVMDPPTFFFTFKTNYVGRESVTFFELWATKKKRERRLPIRLQIADIGQLNLTESKSILIMFNKICFVY